MLNKVIIALDQLSEEEIGHYLEGQLAPFEHFKIGLELFNKLGKSYVFDFHQRYQKNIFLDLKLHDIPVTVHQAIKSLESLPVTFLTIHLAGGEEMINQAIKARDQYLPNTKILGVSYLTSLDHQDFSQIWGVTNQEQVTNLFSNIFKIALKSEIDGLILSPKELELVQKLEKSSNNNLLKITPGIRFNDGLTNQTDDQKRVMSPEDAFQQGADFLVMGRSLINCDQFDSKLEQLKKIKL